MVVEARIAARARAARRRSCSTGWSTCSRRCGLPDHARATCRRPSTATRCSRAMEKVRLIRAGSLRFVLPLRLGETVIADDVSEARSRRRSTPAACAACDDAE